MCSSNNWRDRRDTGTSKLVSSQASSNTLGVVVSYWKRPVSHTSAA